MTKIEFADLTKSLFVALNQDAPTVEFMRDWWEKLNHIQVKTLETAYDAIIDHKAAPTLDNVLSFVQPPEKPPIDKILDYKLKHDGKDWARKILNTPKNREAIAIKYAKIALNIKA
jgi:translation initiation factor IF-3